MRKKIIIAGGSGFLGQALVRHFAKTNADVVVLSRSQSPPIATERYVKWDAETLGDWAYELDGAHVLINLNGKSVDCRYNDRNKKEILDTRVNSTRVLAEAIQKCVYAPMVWFNAASATIYGHSLDKEMTEVNGEYGHGFSVDVCKQWEKAFFESNVPNTRQVAMRIAIVLGRGGGVMKPFIRMAKLWAGGRQGKGNQYFSWIHEDDFVGAIDFLIEHQEISGPVNTVAPNPETNKEQMRLLRKAVGVPFGFPMPKWLLKIGAAIIGTETELILKSRRVVPGKLLDAGFEFEHPDLDEAFKDLVA